MKESFGGIVSFFMLAVFLIIVIGMLGLVVSYTKAFKVKNMIITSIEQYQGLGCDNPNSPCVKNIDEGAKNLGFAPVSLSCSSGYTKMKDLYCYKVVYVKSTNPKEYYYRVGTQVDVHFPIVSDVLGFDLFKVSGDTRVMKSDF